MKDRYKLVWESHSPYIYDNERREYVAYIANSGFGPIARLRPLGEVMVAALNSDDRVRKLNADAPG